MDAHGVCGYYLGALRAGARFVGSIRPGPRECISTMVSRPSSEAMMPAGTFAAVDLGSNSFHLIVARMDHGQLQVVDRLREMVRLGGGLDAHNELSQEARERALTCLERFGQRLRALPSQSVRAVGTNTLRKARHAYDFLQAARTALGHPIEIISGIEEARLIYLGVAHSLADNGQRRLVVDIGGGSTEVIVGERFEALHLESLYMGCVSMSREFFSSGKIDKGAWAKAEIAAGIELESVTAAFNQAGWADAVGASGTARAIAKVLVGEGWSDQGITAEGLRKLRKAMLNAGHVDKLSLKGLSSERAPVFPGGVVIMKSLFEALDVESMDVADGALREGLIYDQLGRIAHEDVRERSVEAMCTRYHVDVVHAQRVRDTALDLFDQISAEWDLVDGEPRHWLEWAARLHEIGLAVAHAQFHKHGAYLVQYSDMLGFSRQEQLLLAALVRSHRRKFPLTAFNELAESLRAPAIRLAILLRIAVKLRRSRTAAALPAIDLKLTDAGICLTFPKGWLEAHPLTAADLARESQYLAATGDSFELC